MNKKIITLDVTKVGEGHLETMMKVNNGFWVALQDHVNEELTERAKR